MSLGEVNTTHNVAVGMLLNSEDLIAGLGPICYYKHPSEPRSWTSFWVCLVFMASNFRAMVWLPKIGSSWARKALTWCFILGMRFWRTMENVLSVWLSLTGFWSIGVARLCQRRWVGLRLQTLWGIESRWEAGFGWNRRLAAVSSERIGLAWPF